MRASSIAIALLLAACDAGSTDDAGLSTDDAGSSSARDVGPARACGAAETRSGEATYYVEADGSGNCSFPATPDDLMVAALNDPDYGDADFCGACAHVVGPSGEVTVRIVDRCPECASGDLDLSPSAFDRIAARELGRVPITWEIVPCEVDGPVRYHFKDGSNPWWVAIQVRGHRHAIASMEARVDGHWVALPRERYNYFVREAGLGEGDIALRITDVYGHALEDTGLPLMDDGEVPGAAQLPACE